MYIFISISRVRGANTELSSIKISLAIIYKTNDRNDISFLNNGSKEKIRFR
jgi:hypothetical protein